MLKSTRAGFGAAITKLGQTNPSVVVVSADLASSVKVADFAKAYPERFFECGVAENNMMGVASGLALAGKIPFACSFAAFSPYINWAVIRQSVCLNNANVKIASTHAGLMTGPDGATHQALEDLALMQVLPGMTVVVPADFDQAYEATLQAAKINGPVYLRLARPDTEQIKEFKSFRVSDFEIRKAQVLKEGKDLTVISCGPIIFEVIKAIQFLEKNNYSSSEAPAESKSSSRQTGSRQARTVNQPSLELINCHTLKPLDEKTLINSVKKTKKCLVVEDHQVFGGLGTTIAQLLSRKYPVPIKMMGVNDVFGQSARKESELLKHYKLDAASISKQIADFIKK